ncbi:CG9935, isoform B [Mycolicibacterium canariasense]|uniref:CG9935, isoform B n=1 Tax=Mycolicibacterium canariasense TaxID=228230 RepID=A0A100WDL2_MYCCR|nr:hypothetical protein [Mycolicibacterium canariasense]MCV7207969.1 hypothetical protein [Mycolicibacterium canariasense]GAS95963.1 CG9935, isoform B [Mycolicibacterium canariasense]
MVSWAEISEDGAAEAVPLASSPKPSPAAIKPMCTNTFLTEQVSFAVRFVTINPMVRISEIAETHRESTPPDQNFWWNFLAAHHVRTSAKVEWCLARRALGAAWPACAEWPIASG